MPLGLKLDKGHKDPSYTFHRITGDNEVRKANREFIEEKARELLGAGFVRIDRRNGVPLTLVTFKGTPGFRSFKAWLVKHEF